AYMKLALLTCSKYPELLEADQILVPLLQQKGFDTEIVIWDDPKINWQQFDYLIFRNTWDYYEKEIAFRAWLDELASQNIKTLNPLSLIQWNMHKFYLKSLEEKGIPILKTCFLEKGKPFNFENIPPSWNELVLKPAFSAGSYLTVKFKREDWPAIQKDYAGHFAEKDFLLQEFSPEIQTLGESSFIFFNGNYSHAINKKPVENDFRVQIQYGGQYVSIKPDTAIVDQARNVLDALPSPSLYARVDGIVSNGILKVMEIELIEPDLYFRVLPETAQHFADDIDQWVLKSS
ncbi:MAG: RimK family alpha-L-glutamate ligase, partial [Flavobacterium sp.]